MKTSLWRLESTHKTDRIISISMTAISLFVLAALSLFLYLGIQMHSYNTGLGLSDFFGTYVAIYSFGSAAVALLFLNARFLGEAGNGYGAAILLLAGVLLTIGLYIFYLLLAAALSNNISIPVRYFIWLLTPLIILSIIFIRLIIAQFSNKTEFKDHPAV